MKLMRPWMFKPLSWLGYSLARPWLASLKYECHPLGPAVEPLTPGLKQRYIYAFWHENMLVPARQYGPSGAQVMISRSADGQLIAEMCRRFGLTTVHGSSDREKAPSGRPRSRGGAEALLQIVRGGGKNHVVITPDGPLGPRRKIKSGLTYLAARTGMPLVAVGFAYARCWRFNSWDRFAVPKPFSRVVGVTGVPMMVPADADRDQLEEYRQQFERLMYEVDAAAERWLEQGQRAAA
jgi:lysophospholipid acyltransferase (LPLAT)-like uncharacterized protein